MLSQEAGIIVAGGRELAGGLYWQVAESKATAIKEARTLASDIGISADLLVLRDGDIVQYGLGWTSTDHVAGQEAGAPLVADAIGIDFAAAFEIGVHPDGRRMYWLVIVHDGAIAPEGDKIVRGYDEARQRFEELLAGFKDGFARLIAPSEWAIEGADETALQSLLDETKGPLLRPAATFLSRLGDMARSKPEGQGAPKNKLREAVLGIVAVAGIGLFAWNWWEEERESAQVAEAIEMARKALPSQLQPAAPIQVAEIVPPWESVPLPGIRLASCREALAQIVVSIPGWTLSDMWCRNQEAGAAWQRTAIPGAGGHALGGTIADFGVAAGKHGIAWTIEAGGDRTVATARLGDAAPRGKQQVTNVQTIQRQVFGLFQALNHKLILNAPKPPVMLPGQKPEEAQKNPWREMDIEFITAFPPADWSAVLDGIPGMAVDLYEWRATEMSWKVKGRIHVRS